MLKDYVPTMQKWIVIIINLLILPSCSLLQSTPFTQYISRHKCMDRKEDAFLLHPFPYQSVYPEPWMWHASIRAHPPIQEPPFYKNSKNSHKWLRGNENMSSPRGTGTDGGDVCTRTPGVTANIVEAGKMPCNMGRDLFDKIDSKVHGIYSSTG